MTVWASLSELNGEFKAIKSGLAKVMSFKQETNDRMEKQDTVLGRLDSNMNKMYTHYKGHLGSSNERMIGVEKQISILTSAPRAQAQFGDFDFGHDQTGNTKSVEKELQNLRDEILQIKQGQAAPSRQGPPDRATDNLFQGRDRKRFWRG
jgi:hypothetical protein